MLSRLVGPDVRLAVLVPAFNSGADRRGHVGGGVVEHKTGLEVGGDLGVDVAEALAELQHAVAAVQRADDFGGAQVDRRVEA